MKRLLLFGMVATLLTIVGVQRASAQASYNHIYTEGVEVAAGGNYFLYNIGSKMFLSNGRAWGTHAVCDHAGRIVTFAAPAGENAYTIYSQSFSVNNGSEAKAGYVCTDGYIDEPDINASRVGKWTFTPVEGRTNVYTINASDAQYLVYDPNTCEVNVQASSGDDKSYWIIIPLATRQAANDYTYLLQNPDFIRPWEQFVWSDYDKFTGEWAFGNQRSGGNESNPCAEMFGKAFDVKQTIAVNIPNGKYIVYNQGFSNNPEENNKAKLYANADEVELTAQNDENSMADASTSFSAGNHINTVTTIVTDGHLAIGVKSAATAGNNWVAFDNFGIEYLGQTLSTGVAVALPGDGAMEAEQWYYFDVNTTDAYILSAGQFANVVYETNGSLLAREATGTAFSAQVQELSEGRYYMKPSEGRYYIKSSTDNTFKVDPVSITLPEGKMYATVNKEMQAAYSTFQNEPTYANYTALVAKIEAANASIEEYVLINNRINLLKAQLGDIPVADAETDAFVTNYTNGVYENLDQVIPAYQDFVKNYWSTHTPGENADLTAFIINPSLDFGDATGWSGGGVNNGTIEWFNGNYNVFQTLTGLPTGTYKLQAQGYYRPGSNVNPSTAQNALLYGGTSTTHVALIASGGKSAEDATNGYTTANTNSGSTVYVPNWQPEAEKVFATSEDIYMNEVEFVVNGDSVNIGFKKDVYIQDDWTCFGNFKLIYIATIAPALAEGQMSQTAKQAMLDAQATYNTTPSVENYNTLLAKIDEANQSIQVYEQINNALTKLTSESQRGSISEKDAKDMPFFTKYSAGQVNGAADTTTGTYETLDDMFAQYKTDIAAYWAANVAAGKDLTAYIVNQGFEFGNYEGWNETHGGRYPDVGARRVDIMEMDEDTQEEKSKYGFSDSEGDYVFNSWNDGWGAITLTQTLTGLPQGTYELTAVFAAEGFNNIEFIGTNIREDSTEDETADKFRPVDINQRADKKTGLTRTIEVFVTDGKLKINGNTWGFFKADNFRLVYKSATLSDLANEPMNRYEKNNYDAAKAAYEENQTIENLRELAACKIICENSIKAYKAAKKTLDHVKDMMDHTNVYTYEAFFTIDDMYRKYGPEEGFYGFRTLEDDVAYDLERMFFGNGNYRDSNNENIPAVPFIASAWDCGHNGYAYVETGPGKEGTDPGSDYYGNTWSREGLDDGTNMLTPYLEYWRPDDNLLDKRVMTATVEGTPNAEYTVKMFVRVRTNVKYVEGDNSTKPHGMTIQIGDGAKFTPNWQYIDNEGTQYVLNNGRQLWVCNLWLPAHQGDANNASYLLPTGNADAEGNFKIKFEIEEGSNVTWLSMKDVYVNYETEVPAEEMAALEAQINYADAHKLGFDFKGDKNGTTVDEYAPYNNVPQLIALKRAKQVHDSPQNVFLVRNVTKALKAVNYNDPNMNDLQPVYNEATDLWTKNTEEMNGFYWKNDYTSADVQHVEWNEFEDDCITPSGWELIGRNDGFSTGIKKLGVNTEDKGMKALEDQTGLLTKYETDYGRQVGYTLPLKKGVKYIMTFKYAYMGEGTCTEPTNITLTVPAAGASGDDTTASGLKVTTFTPEGQGTEDLGKWKMYRATFTPTIENEEHPGEPVNYLITFDKNNAHDPVPIMMGELTLVRYKEAAALGNNILIDGTNQAGYSYTPDFVGGDFKLTRSWNPGAYNTLVLPFTLDGSELKTALGENFDGKVYFYKGAKNTSGEYYQLQFEARENGGIFANVPVMIWCDATNRINSLEGYTFEKTVTQYVDNDTDDDNHPTIFDPEGYDFVGTYETITIPAGASYIWQDNTFHKSQGSSYLAATRAYFIPLDVKRNLNAGAKLMGFSIDEVPTGIVAIEEDGEMHVTSGNIYTVDGRLVRANATSLEGLPSGTYIVDGKKYYVK